MTLLVNQTETSASISSYTLLPTSFFLTALTVISPSIIVNIHLHLIQQILSFPHSPLPVHAAELRLMITRLFITDGSPIIAKSDECIEFIKVNISRRSVTDSWCQSTDFLILSASHSRHHLLILLDYRLNMFACIGKYLNRTLFFLIRDLLPELEHSTQPLSNNKLKFLLLNPIVAAPSQADFLIIGMGYHSETCLI